MDCDLGVLVQTVVVGLVQSAPTPSATVSSNPGGWVIEIAKLLLLAVPGYLAARHHAKKEQRTEETTREDSLVAGFKSMSLQAREQLTTALEDAAREREMRRAAEARIVELERERDELRAKGRRRRAEGAD